MNTARLFQIITEELEDFYDYGSEQSMADKYFERQVALAKAEPQVKVNAELIGYISNQFGRQLPQPIPVYKNPKTLEGFKSECRGVLLANGEFYCSTSSQTVHDYILQLLSEKGIVPYAKIYDYRLNYPEEFVCVQRVALTERFAQSTAYDDVPEYYNQIFDIANKTQPFTFIPIDYNWNNSNEDNY
jgi:hypothetical protein